MLKNAQEQLFELGNAIRIQRKLLKVSATAAAESAGLSRVTWYRLEKSEPSVSAGAYFSALAVLGLQIKVDLLKQNDSTLPAKDSIPLSIPFKNYPQLKFLAWQIHGSDYLSPKEAWTIYQRNWRHVEEDNIEPHEQELIQQLQTLFEG